METGTQFSTLQAAPIGEGGMQDHSGVVFGASGYLGRAICQRLAEDRPTVAFARDVARAPSGPNIVAAARGEITRSPPAIEAGALGIDGSRFVVFQCVGSSRERRSSFIRETNLLATRHVVEWALRNSAERVVFFSGFGVSPNTSSVYFRSKFDAEQELIKACENRIEYVILRPSYIIGGEDELVPHLMRQVSGNEVVVPGTEDYLIQPLFMEDVLCIAGKLRDAEIKSGIYDLLGEPITLADFYRAILDRLGVRVPIRPRPIEEYIREAVIDEEAQLTLSQIGILCSNITGPKTESLFGCPIRGARAVIDGLVEHWRDKASAGVR